MLLSGLVVGLTRDGAKQRLDETTNTFVLTEAESHVGTATLVVTGTVLAGLGAYWLWFEAPFSELLDGKVKSGGDTGVTSRGMVLPLPGGATFSYGMTF